MPERDKIWSSDIVVTRFLLEEAFEMLASQEVETALIALLPVLDRAVLAKKSDSDRVLRIVLTILKDLADSFIKGDMDYVGLGVVRDSGQYRLIAKVTVKSPLALLIKGFLLSPVGDLSKLIKPLQRYYCSESLEKLGAFKGEPWEEREEIQRKYQVAQFLHIVISLIEQSMSGYRRP